MIREMELLFQASRTSPMLHEAAVTVEEGIAALRTERDELVLANERLGNDIVAAEVALAEMRRALEAFDRLYDKAQNARRLYVRSGVVPTEALVVADSLYGILKHHRALAAADGTPKDTA